MYLCEGIPIIIVVVIIIIITTIILFLSFFFLFLFLSESEREGGGGGELDRLLWLEPPLKAKSPLIPFCKTADSGSYCACANEIPSKMPSIQARTCPETLLSRCESIIEQENLP